MKNSKKNLVCIWIAGTMLVTGCAASGATDSTSQNDTTETAVLTLRPTATPTVAPIVTITPTVAPTVKETTAATPTPTETTTAATTAKETTAATTAKPTPKPTAKPTVKETTAATTAAPTQTAPPATTATTPAYTENCDNIKNLIIAKLQAKGLWYPDEPQIGDDSKGWSLGYNVSDEKYAEAYVNAKYGNSTFTIGCTSVSCWIADGFIWVSSTKCALPQG